MNIPLKSFILPNKSVVGQTLLNFIVDYSKKYEELHAYVLYTNRVQKINFFFMLVRGFRRIMVHMHVYSRLHFISPHQNTDKVSELSEVLN